MFENTTISKSTEETEEIAQDFAKKLKGGEVVALVGDLGAGKTTFVKGIAKGLGIKQNITSPTFVLLKEYRTKVRNPKLEIRNKLKISNSKSKIRNWKLGIRNLVHIDCYRLKSPKDALSLGITDYLGKKDSIVLIEWPEKISKILSAVEGPKKTIKIKFEHISENQRSIKIYSLIG